MAGRRATILLLGALALGACGSGDDPLPVACLAGSTAVERALTAAPGPVVLGGGTRLSECVDKAHGDADLQNVGVMLTQTADRLRLRAEGDPGAALRLGYLIGATRRGAGRSNGIALELARRLERTAFGMDLRPAAIRSALARGVRAGERSG